MPNSEETDPWPVHTWHHTGNLCRFGGHHGSKQKANPDIHNLAYLQNHRQRPAFHGTPTQSRKVVSRPVNTKDCVTLGVGSDIELRFNLWPSLQPRNCYFGETTKMRTNKVI